MSLAGSLLFRRISTLLLLSLFFTPHNSSFAENDPYPGVSNGAEIPGTRIQSSPGVTQSEWEATSTFQNWNCPANSGRAMGVDLNFTTARNDDVWYNYCVKQWQPKETVDAWAKYRLDLAAAQAAAESESKAWNAANPGKQKCVQWGPISDPNGGTSSGGVCANPVDPGPNTTVPTQSAPSVEAPSTSTSSGSNSPISSSPNTSSTNETTTTTNSTVNNSTNASTPASTPVPTEDFSKWGSGTPFTRVLKGQLSTSDCPSGFQAANGIIVAIGSGTFTECWPENAWSAYRLGGNIWEQFKTSGGTYDAKAELDRRNKVSELKALAKSVAQTAADQTPGIQRCSKWNGYGESGEECAYTFVKPTSTSNASTGSNAPDAGASETNTSTTSITGVSTSVPNPEPSSSTPVSEDPYPNLSNGDEIPNTRITSAPGVTQSEWEQSSVYKGHICPSGSGKASGVDLNFTISQNDDKRFVYCVKSIRTTSTSASDSSTASTSSAPTANSNLGNSDTSTATSASSSENASSGTTTSSSSSETSTTASSTSGDTESKNSNNATTSTESSTPTLQTKAIEVNGTVNELKSLVGKVVEDQREAKSISTLINRLDSVISKTSVKQIKLPGSSQVQESAESKTPDMCSVSGVTVNSLKKGACLIAYTVVDSDGNRFTTQKEIYFRK
jgi:hypothetical protein